MANAGLILVSVLTLNIWGLPDIGFKILSPLRKERVAAICAKLKEASARRNGWDIVLLQEVWVEKDRRNLQKCGYPFYAEVEDGSLPLDTGLLVLSKYKIIETERLTYPALLRFNLSEEDGESFARKSALLVKIEHPGIGNLWVANTHLVSQYSQTNDVYESSRRRQFIAFAEWASSMAGKEPLILGGDWNFGPRMPLWSLIEIHLKGFSQGTATLNACTICPPNTMHTVNEGKVDHLFGSSHFSKVEGRQAMTEPMILPDLTMSLSDHFGWEATFSP